MRFSDTARLAINEAKDKFGTYSYYDKGASEVMDVDGLVRKLRKMKNQDIVTELKHLAARTDCDLEPSLLVRDILGSIDDDEKFNDVFEDEELMEHY